MEYNPITTMREEHELISKTENIINNLDGMWNDDIESYKKHVNELIEFFRDFADGIHHKKEEEVLFPAIKDHDEFIMEEIVDEMEQHHDDFRVYSNEIEEAINDKDYQRSYEILSNYCNDLLDHIAVENDELFVLAETLLDENTLEMIYFKFKDIDIEIGEDRIEALKQLVDKPEFVS